MRIWALIIKTPKLQSTHIMYAHIPRAIAAIATQYPTYGYDWSWLNCVNEERWQIVRKCAGSCVTWVYKSKPSLRNGVQQIVTTNSHDILV